MTNLPGVYTAKKKDGTIYYRSSITYKNKHISLGSFKTPDMANKCYRLAKEITTSSVGVMDYTTTSSLAFDKWVSLVNFRDHNYYFKTPIYLHKHYFVYHLTPNEDLYFDIEDLFYYSTHKIHKRNGYYFVNDYGMQVNILSRYKIKNHAVEGRDFCFVDGDNHNYRYDNLEIINPYYGVTRESTSHSVVYKASININGSYIIGRYNSEIHAATAYNKAVDFLSNYGISEKDFPKNYLSDLGREEYLDIYKHVEISKKILALFDKTSI